MIAFKAKATERLASEFGSHHFLKTLTIVLKKTTKIEEDAQLFDALSKNQEDDTEFG